jgi:hypothetical protein
MLSTLALCQRSRNKWIGGGEVLAKLNGYEHSDSNG